jgi:hypothetical protein
MGTIIDLGDCVEILGKTGRVEAFSSYYNTLAVTLYAKTRATMTHSIASNPLPS